MVPDTKLEQPSTWIRTIDKMPPQGTTVLIRRMGTERTPQWEWQPLLSSTREARLKAALGQWLHDFGSNDELSQRTRILLGE
jgi:hypothetical protein